MLEFKNTDHSYYCSENNYYVGGSDNFGRAEYDNFNDFLESWTMADGDIDDDYNHLFRFDIEDCLDKETEEPNGSKRLWLFFILQRKGIYRPVLIKEILPSDIEKLNVFLSKRWEYLKCQWIEISEEATKRHTHRNNYYICNLQIRYLWNT